MADKKSSKVTVLPKSVGPKTLTLGLQALVTLWKPIVQLVNLHGAGATSEQKEAAAQELLMQAGGVAVQAVAANNPEYAQAFSVVNAGIVGQMNADGSMPELPAPNLATAAT